MAEIGGSRFYTGPETEQRSTWVCPACHARNVSRFEDGCPSCGTGTKAQAELATRAKASVAEVIDEQLRALVDVENDAGLVIGLTPRARLTLAMALAHYADHGAVTPAELPRQVILAWARTLIATMDG